MNLKEGFILKQENNKRAVILFHGLTGSPFEMLFYGKSLYKAGFDVYCSVLPGHCQGVNEIRKSIWQDWQGFAIAEYDKIRNHYDEVYVSGLCLGAVLALGVGQERDNVSGIIALSTTLFLDGWCMPWFMFLIPLGLYTVLKFFYVFPEADPYGIKNEIMRKKVSKILESNDSALDCIPMISVLELLRLSKYIIKNLWKINAPVLLFHSKEDDLTSIKSAQTVYSEVSSKISEFVKLNNSYHLIILDNDKDIVVKKTLEFISKISGYENKKLLKTSKANT